MNRVSEGTEAGQRQDRAAAGQGGEGTELREGSRLSAGGCCLWCKGKLGNVQGWGRVWEAVCVCHSSWRCGRQMRNLVAAVQGPAKVFSCAPPRNCQSGRAASEAAPSLQAPRVSATDAAVPQHSGSTAQVLSHHSRPSKSGCSSSGWVAPLICEGGWEPQGRRSSGLEEEGSWSSEWCVASPHRSVHF